MGDDFAELSPPEPAPEEADQAPELEPLQAPAAEPVQGLAAEPVQGLAAEPVQALPAEPVQGLAAEPVQAPAAEPAGPAAAAAPAQDERFVSAEHVAGAPAGSSGAADKPRDAVLVCETDEQGIAAAAAEPTAAPAAPDPIPNAAGAAGAGAPAALGAASAAAAAEAAARGRAPNPVHVHRPRAPLPAPRMGAGPAQSFAEALPRMGRGALGAAAAVLVALALALSWRWTAAYGPLAALPGVLLGLCAALLALAGWAITEHVLPLTSPLTRAPPESITALARNIVRPCCQPRSLAQRSATCQAGGCAGGISAWVVRRNLGWGSASQVSETWECSTAALHCPHWNGRVQVTAHAMVRLWATRALHAALDWVVGRPLYLVDFHCFAIPQRHAPPYTRSSPVVHGPKTEYSLLTCSQPEARICTHYAHWPVRRGDAYCHTTPLGLPEGLAGQTRHKDHGRLTDACAACAG